MEPRYLVYQGYLRKSPPEKKMATDKWQKRYFKLWNDQILEYYRSKTDKKPIKEPLDLTQCTRVCDASQDYDKYLGGKPRWAFCLEMPGRLFVLVAYSDDDRALWKEKICGLCSLANENNNHIPAVVQTKLMAPNTSSASSNSSLSGGTETPETNRRPLDHILAKRTSSNASGDSDQHSNNYDEPPSRTLNENNKNKLSSNSCREPNKLRGVDSVLGARTMTVSSTDSDQGFKGRNDSDVFSNNSLYDIPPPSNENKNLYDLPPPSSGRNNYDMVPPSRTKPFDRNSNELYDIPPPASFKSRGTNVPSEAYDFVPPRNTYDFVPPKNHVVGNTPQRLKQTNTKLPNEVGYVKMDPSNDIEYMHMEGRDSQSTNEEEYIMMNGEDYTPLPSSPKPVKEFKSISDNLEKLRKQSSNTVNVYGASPPSNSSRLATDLEKNPLMDEAPKNCPATDSSAPTVDRNAKPGPAVDRSMKPKFSVGDGTSPRYSDSSSTSSGYFNFSPPTPDGTFPNPFRSSNEIYYNDQVAPNNNTTARDNNTWYNYVQPKPKPASNTAMTSVTSDITGDYNNRDSNNNNSHPGDEYQRKNLPPVPAVHDEANEDAECLYVSPTNNRPQSYESNVSYGSQDVYENFSGPDECYQNVGDISKVGGLKVVVNK